MKKKKKSVKKQNNFHEEEDPVDRDFSNLIKNGEWSPFSNYFQFVPKDKTITLRISDDLLKQIKKLADKKNTKYQKLIREALILYIAKAS